MTLSNSQIPSSAEDAFEEPTPCRLNRKTIEGLGAFFAQHYDINEKQNLDAVVKAFGGTLVRDPNTDAASQCAIEVPKDFPQTPFKIRLNPFPSPETDRLGIAHELGHFVLHYLVQRKARQSAPFGLRADFRVESDNEDLVIAELEADWFAYGFLLSDDVVKRVMNEAKNNNTDAVIMLTTRYQVPPLVAFERVRSIFPESGTDKT